VAKAPPPPAADGSGGPPQSSSKSKSPFVGDGAEKERDRGACQGFALAKTAGPGARVLAPEVLVDPGDGKEPSVGYGSAFHPTEIGNVAVLEDADGKPLETSLHLPDAAAASFVRMRAATRQDCLLPRAAAYDAQENTVLVACLGIDAVVAYDAKSYDPHGLEHRRWRVAAGPTGLAIDAPSRTLVVWSQFDRVVDFLPLDEPPPAAMKADGEIADEAPSPSHHVLAVSRKAAMAAGDVELGRKLFHAAGDPRISADGRACASCHPDGRDDTLTWATPEGPRNTPMLAGRVAGTAPYGWLGAGSDVRGHLAETFRRLRGAGIEDREMEALVAYVTTMRGPGTGTGTGTGQVERGREVFASAEVGCAGCHLPDQGFTDGARHDVGSADDGSPKPFAPPGTIAARLVGAFDTPSLRFIGGTAPYFHDGRYATLSDALLGSDGHMGHVSQLSREDFAALEAYVRTL
jgi:cytochrome c553